MAKKDSSDGLHGITSSWLGRTWKTSAIGRDIAKEIAKNRVKGLFVTKAARQSMLDDEKEVIARLLRDQLGRLKGLAMKLGQMLSYMDAGMPDSVRDILASLQDRSEAMAPSVVDGLIKSELGQDRQRLFAEWRSQPIGVASIGQVHWARLSDGREVAVKIQYPEIAKAFDSDFLGLQVVGNLIEALLPGFEMPAVIEELRARLKEECDYSFELNNQETFRKLFADDPDVIVPATISEFSTARVLTTEFIKGQRFADFQKGADQDTKNRAATIIYRMVNQSVWRHHIFNGDPHPGNYLFVTSGAQVRVAFLDFGCVKRWNQKAIRVASSFLHSALAGDPDEFRRVCLEIGVIRREVGLDFEAYRLSTLATFRPLVFAGSFTFSKEFLLWMNKSMDEKVDKFRIKAIPDLTFLARLWWGLYSVLTMLNATVDCQAIAAPLLYPPESGKTMPRVPRHSVDF